MSDAITKNIAIPVTKLHEDSIPFCDMEMYRWSNTKTGEPVASLSVNPGGTYLREYEEERVERIYKVKHKDLGAFIMNRF